jgi:ribosomal protein L32
MRGMDIIDWFQQRKLRDHTIDISEAKGAASESTRRAEELQVTVDRLMLVSRALWELLAESCSISEQALEDKVIEIDRRDGREDGRISAKLEPCKACGRVNHSRHRKCLYCGETLQRSPFG